MSNNFFRIDKGASFAGQATPPSNPINGDKYYDSVRNTMVEYINGNWSDMQSRSDVASSASLTSSNFTAAVVQSSVVRITGSTLSSIHGLTAASDAKQVLIYNQSSTTQLVKHQSGTEGTAANRIITSAGGDVSISAGESALFIYDSAQSRWVLATVSGGGSGTGSKNYFTAQQSSGTVTSGFNSYLDAVQALPEDGTSGSPSGNLNLATSLTSPLSGLSSLTLAKTGSVSTQGEGKSIDFTLDNSDKGKVLAFSMNYAIASGTYADDDQIIYFYDVTNSMLLEPVPYKIKNHGLVSERFFTEIQVPYNCDTLRMIFHTSSASALDYTLKIDDLVFGPQAKLYGSVVTDWVTYTPTITGAGTPSTVSFQYKRSASDIEVIGQFTSGTPTATSLAFSLPSGLVIDSAKLPTQTFGGVQVPGHIMIATGSTTNPSTTNGPWLPIASTGTSTTNIYVSRQTVVGNFALENANNILTNGSGVSVAFKIPIVGWSSSQLLSNDADTRVVAFTGNMAVTAQTTGVPVDVLYSNSVRDTHGAYNTSTGVYTVKVPGWYSIDVSTFQQGTVSTFASILLTKDDNTLIEELTRIPGASASSSLLQGSTKKYFNTGDTFKIRALANGSSLQVYGDNSISYLSINRLSGPAQIAASEKVRAKYSSAAGQSIPNVTSTIVDFGTKVYDSHGSVTTGGAWKFTAKRSGLLKIYSIINYAADTFNATADTYLEVFKNGVSVGMIDFHRVEATTAFNMPALRGQHSMEVLEGDYFDLRAYQNTGSSKILNPNAYLVQVEIELE